jgi:DNA-binding MarR family transcriptional regulator
MPRIPPFDELAALDKTIHEPARLAILTALSACRSAQFRYLYALIGLTQGNLSMHLAKLEQEGLIEIEKFFSGKYSSTSVSLTDAGRKAIARHWKQLENLKISAARLPRVEQILKTGV